MICLLKEYHRVLSNMPLLSNVCDVLLGDVVHPLQYYQPSQVMAVGNVDEAPVCNPNRGHLNMNSVKNPQKSFSRLSRQRSQKHSPKSPIEQIKFSENLSSMQWMLLKKLTVG